MADYQGKYTGAQVDALLGKAGTAVQQVAGKGLSTNDYTNEDKQKVNDIYTAVANFSAYDTPESSSYQTVLNAFNSGKKLQCFYIYDSTNRQLLDYIGYYDNAFHFQGFYKDKTKILHTAISNQNVWSVDKNSGFVASVSGKGLSTNDYTDADKEEVAKVAQLAQKVSDNEEDLDYVLKTKVNKSELEKDEEAIAASLTELDKRTKDISEDVGKCYTKAEVDALLEAIRSEIASTDK